MVKSVRLKITGRVHHVGFRYFATNEAGKYDVKGWVRNEPDGSVLVEAEAEEHDLDSFIISLRKGPGWARVDHLDLQSIPFAGYKDFGVRY